MVHSEISVGDLVDGRYRLDELLGGGGFGRVFRAHDVRRQTDVAVKVVTADSDSDARRTAREVSILAALTSRHTISLIDHGQLGPLQHYLVLELLGGCDLADEIDASGSLDAAQTVRILRHVAKSLAEAHRAGILHRDIKPENIRIVRSDSGRINAKLFDFGIARPTDDGSPGLTATGEIVGTPRYMSPEQLTGQPLGPASDLYSLGMVAIECLAGRDAIQGALVSDQLVRLQSGYSFELDGLDAGPRLIRILERMTARAPADRFQSADAVLRALDRLTTGPGDVAKPRTAARTLSFTHAMALGVLGALAIGAILFALSEPEPPRRAIVSAPIPAVSPTPVARRPDVAMHADHRLADSADAQTDGASSGCGLSPQFVGHGQLMLGMKTFVYVPPTYDPDVPHTAIFMLHDDWHDPQHWIKTSGFVEIADRHNTIVFGPYDGIASVWRRDREETGRMHQLFEFAQTEFCIDPERVLFVGQGHGGSAVHRVTCEPWVSAAAINSRPYVGADPCAHGKQLAPFLFMFPLNNPTVPRDGGINCANDHKPSMGEQEAILKRRHGCRGQETKYFEAPEGSCVRWECDVPLASCRFDGGRGWPGSQRRVDPNGCDGNPTTFPSAQAVWKFFEATQSWRGSNTTRSQ